ncbi:hypothetical protein DFH09DRAFT_1309647 [Mycena vulgaris]|nr:hypothetical protein DFH09DRAFT_1309647 [Mycena vulgaris]
MASISKILVSLTFTLASLVMAQEERTAGTVFQITPGLGACGWMNTSTQAVGAVSATTFSKYPGATRNPNKNPICHHFLEITDPDNGISVRVQVVDFFEEDPNAKANDVGIPAIEFKKMANLDDGIIENATWYIV